VVAVSRYQKLDDDFKAAAVRIVEETGKPIARVARDLGVNEGTLGNWVGKALRARDGGSTGLSVALVGTASCDVQAGCPTW
jgi:transposase